MKLYVAFGLMVSSNEPLELDFEMQHEDRL
jgi:hypothetical protein